MIKTQTLAIEIIYKAIPYPSHISNLELTKDETAIYFDWRKHRFKLELQSAHVDELIGSMLHGNDLSILMTELIKKQLFYHSIAELAK